MSAQTTHAEGFPTPCTRCGGVLYQHVDFCPYCGVDHPLDKPPPRRDTALKAVDTRPPERSALVQDDSTDLPVLESSDMPIPIPPMNIQQPFWQTAGRWIITKGLVLLVFVLALGYAGYLLLGDNHKQDSSTEESSTNSAGGSISPYSPQPGGNAPSTTITTVPAAPGIAAAPAIAAAPPARAIQHYRNIPSSLQAARTGLAQNNLAVAKAAIADALSIQSGNADALRMQSDLKDRENRRDVALGVANTCAQDKLWTCVRERAAQALAIDVSSVDAQALLERVILSTGWKTPASAVQEPRPLAPRPSTPRPSTSLPPAAVNLPPLPPMPDNNPPAAAARSTTNTAKPASSAAANNAAGNNAAANNAVASSAVASSAAASSESSIDAQMRAIRDSAWSNASSPGAANK